MDGDGTDRRIGGAAGRRLRMVVASALLALAAVGVYVGSATGDHGPERHLNMTLLANFDDRGNYRVGTDLAFWGNRLIAGNLDQGVGPNASPPGGFRVIDISKPSRPTQIGQYVCSGDQSDVSVWRDIVVTSVDKPAPENCTSGESWEGLRIVSIENPATPEILATVRTDCGSHNNTIVHDKANDRLVVYVSSYPLAGRYNPAGEMVPEDLGGPGCNAVDHREVGIVEVPLSDPASSRVLEGPDHPQLPLDVSPAIGCHDVSLFLERDLAAAACLTESQIWDISDPAAPEVIAHIPNPPGMDLSHSTTFANDGKTLVVGAELGGAAASPGCLTGNPSDPLGGLFFFDIAGERASSPRFLSSFKLPQQVANLLCTAHQFNVVPRVDDRDVLVSSWYTGGTSVIDFTGVRDDVPAKQLAYFIPEETVAPVEPREDGVEEAAAWASYWYRGHVYSSNFDEDVNSLSPESRGLDVFTVDHPAVRGALRLNHLNPQVQEPIPQNSRG